MNDKTLLFLIENVFLIVKVTEYKTTLFTGVTVTVYPLLYVGNIIFIASTSALVHRIYTTLQHEFMIMNLGPLCHFLDILVC